MELQQAFDAGFDAVKAYIDNIADEFERRFAELDAQATEAGLPDLPAASLQPKRRRSIPPYPAHLSPEEQTAMFEKAERDLYRKILPDENRKKNTAKLDTLVKLASTLLIQDAWHHDRITALEKKEAKR